MSTIGADQCSKTRKVKCDKIRPICHNCTNRGDSHVCKYLSEHNHPPSPAATSGSSSFSCESTTAHTTPYPPLSTPGHPADIAASPNDTIRDYTLSALDHLSACAQEIRSKLSERSKVFSAESELLASINNVWPNILSTESIAQRPARWVAEMEVNISALPTTAEIQRLVDHYFTELEVVGKSASAGSHR
jgi:hypothetical protein